ncbi:hypothetical protein OPV22_016284 [Ensete ventricosum]|uniref:Uncharacterized protein n=1 Tax=Ensete ventricosum TaxID=4639 RepID=A0AAV8QV33_ENSVE|nr:hypothetical protein OPV22_016284 [Ensete ventricosum]
MFSAAALFDRRWGGTKTREAVRASVASTSAAGLNQRILAAMKWPPLVCLRRSSSDPCATPRHALATPPCNARILTNRPDRVCNPMEEEDPSGGFHFRWHGSHSLLATIAGRSQSCRLILESSSAVAEHSAAITKYKRLSRSTRSPDERPRQQRASGARWLLPHFFLRKAGEVPRETNKGKTKKTEKKKMKKKKKSWSSWLPDPTRRWPVQGW